MRQTVGWGLPLAPAGAAVGAAHSVALPLAVAAGVVLTVVMLILAVTWRRPWSWPALWATVVLLAWPALAWSYWWPFPILFALTLALVGRAFRRTGALLLGEENRQRREDGDPPYVVSQEAREEAYRRSQGR